MMRTLPLALVLLVSSAAFAQKATVPSALAERVVVDVAAVKEGEVVFVAGEIADIALLHDLYLAVAKHGGLPFLKVSDVKLDRKWYDVVPSKYDRNRGLMEEKVIGIPDVLLQLDKRDTAWLKDVPVDRRTAVGEGFNGMGEKSIKRGTRQIFLGNGLFPTKESAKSAGVGEADLKKLFEAGLAVDGKALNAMGEAVRTAAQTGKDITIETPAGTSLKLKITSKPMVVSDGVISAAEAKTGGAALLTWLPAGEVYGLIAPGSAEGKIVVPRLTTDGGDEIKDVTFTVAAGKVTGITVAKPSKVFDAWKAIYDAAGAGKDAVSVLDIGLNPAVKQKGKSILNFVPAGTITIAVGGDEWAGGSNKLSYANALYLTDATLKAGDVVVVEKGELKVAAK